MGPGQFATGRVVWSCGVLYPFISVCKTVVRQILTFAALSGLLWAFGDCGRVETVETLRDCGDFTRLLVTWHGVQSGSRRKAEFEWVGMVGVGLGRRTAIAQTAGVRRGWESLQHASMACTRHKSNPGPRRRCTRAWRAACCMHLLRRYLPLAPPLSCAGRLPLPPVPPAPPPPPS